MQGSKKLPINDLNQYITCQICKGYFVDATTIIECLHTFCRSCIVKYLQANKYCPVCDVQVHKTKPLLNIRPDKTIQDVVYKLVPRLFQNEMQRRRDFYSNHPETKPSSFEQCGESSYQHLLTPEETVCLTLSYHGSENKPRYLRCPAAVSVAHLQKLIRAKYALKENHRVDIFYNQDCLNASLTLMDVAYIYLWKRKGPIELTYRIYECAVKKIKTEAELPEESPMSVNCIVNNNNFTNNNNWKEVQLRISENGEMSITGIDTNLDSSLLEIVNSEPKYKNEVVVTMVPTTSVTTDAARQDKFEGNFTKKGIPLPEITNKISEPQSVNDVQDVTNSTNTSNLTAVTLNIPLLGISDSRTTDIGMQPMISASASLSSATTTTVYSTINETKCSTKSDDTPIKLDQNQIQENFVQAKTGTSNVVPTSAEHALQNSSRMLEISTPCNSIATNSHETNLKRKCETTSEPENEPPSKQMKPNILNHSLQFLNLSNNHPLKKHSKLNHNGENVKNSSPKVVILEHNIIEPPSMLTSSIKIDVPVSKPITLNKIITTVHSPRPNTPVSVTKTIMSTKASIIPPKLPSTTYVGQKQPCYMPKTTYSPVLNVPKPLTTNSSLSNHVKPEMILNSTSTSTSTATTSKADTKVLNINSQQPTHISNSTANPKPPGKTKSATPIGYKTLRDPPKSWNSQISKANFNKSIPDPKYSELKNVRPKFFKMRNNMPRYLGAPASGVKPMYQVHVSPEKDKPAETNKTEKSEIKKHSIVKIDPKTLKPISEKAPETSSLSNHSSSNAGLPNSHNSVTQNFSASTNLSNHAISNLQTELKINTSSVSIFNPLKLQSSPKNDRRSPKSPQSPKLKTSTSPTVSSGNGSSSSKRDKVSVTFTPPNPFVPRLASPTTLGPGQFLYPPPPYDPRVMAAAYTSLWYGQRLAGFAGGAAGLPHPGIGLDLNSQITQQQRKNFELLAAAHTAQMASKSMQITTPPISPISRLPNLPSVPSKSVASSKKKESKSEKSLETTLEKLTQNRHKELNNKPETSDESKPSAEDATKSESKEKSTPATTTSISHTSTSNGTTSEKGTASQAPAGEAKKSSEHQAGQTKERNSDVLPAASNSRESPVSMNVREKNGNEKSPTHSVVSSENPPTDDAKRSESNDTVKTSQCTENIKTNDESSGSKSAKSAERKNDLSDNKNSEKIVEGGE